MSARGPSAASLPASWPRHVRSAVVHTLSLAAAALAATRGWAASHASSRVRLKAELERLEQEVALLEEELRLKDARMRRVPGHHRPHYAPIERLAILELRAVRGWSVVQTSARFHLSHVTLGSWMRRLDERGSAALVQAAEPANKYPDFVELIVQRLKLLCPSLGYGKIAQMLGREGLRLGTSTVQRLIRRPTKTQLEPEPRRVNRFVPMKKVVARYPHHAWHCDLTTVPTSMGIWTSRVPFSLPQRWPFCWWLAVVADQYSARILGFALSRTQPAVADVKALIGRAVKDTGAAPKFLISDKGQQFRDGAFRPWCKRTGIRHLYGALGQSGSIPFIERLIRTIKSECTRRIRFPFSASGARRELGLFALWYNHLRPHERLNGATPEEVHRGAAFPPCPEDGSRSVDRRRMRRLVLRVVYLEGRRHLPIVGLERVA